MLAEPGLLLGPKTSPGAVEAMDGVGGIGGGAIPTSSSKKRHGCGLVATF